MVAILALFATLSGSFTFSGGTIDDLVSSLQEQSGKSVVAGIYEPDSVPAFKCPLNLKSIEKKLAVVAPYELIDCRTCLAVTPTLLPSYIDNFHDFKPYASARRVPRTRPLKFVDGFIDGSTKKGEIVTCLSLIGYDWGAPLGEHWLFAKYGLLFSLAHARRSDVLDAVARCVGAKEVEANATITLGFDPKVWRKRFAACVADPTDVYKDSTLSSALAAKLSNELAVAVFDSVSDDFLVNCFNHANHGYNIEIERGSPAAVAARARLNELESMCEREPMKSGSGGAMTLKLLDMADLSKPYHVVYKAPASMGLGLARKDGPGQILL